MFYSIKQCLLDSKLQCLSIVIQNLIVTTKAHLCNWLLSLTCACVRVWGPGYGCCTSDEGRTLGMRTQFTKWRTWTQAGLQPTIVVRGQTKKCTRIDLNPVDSQTEQRHADIKLCWLCGFCFWVLELCRSGLFYRRFIISDASIFTATVPVFRFTKQAVAQTQE